MSTNDDRCLYRYSDDPGAGLCHAPRGDHEHLSHVFVDSEPSKPADATSPDDKCAGACVDGGLCGYVRRAHGMELGQIGHRFVEPKPAGPPVTGDGDETVVREIANRWTKEWSGSEGRTRMPGPDAIANAVREAIARGRALGAREDELMLFLAESVRDAFECHCEFEGDTCPCEGDGNDDEGCWRCQANAAIARRAGRGQC